MTGRYTVHQHRKQDRKKASYFFYQKKSLQHSTHFKHCDKSITCINLQQSDSFYLSDPASAALLQEMQPSCMHSQLINPCDSQTRIKQPVLIL